MTEETKVKETWSTHLKEYAAANDMTYRQAMSNEEAKASWAAKKPPKEKKVKVVKEKKEKVVKEKVVPETVVPDEPKKKSVKRRSTKEKINNK